MYSDDELYKTAVHEARHALRAVATGNTVLSINLDEGVSVLQWQAFAWELPRIVRTAPTYAVGLVQGIIGTCIAPALAAREPLNPGDEAAYRPFLTAWPRSAPVTRDTLYRQACAETRSWLAEASTKRDVRRLAEKLFIYRHEVLAGETLARVLGIVAPQSTPSLTAVRPKLPTRPDYPVGVLDLEWFQTHTKQTATAPTPTRSTPDADQDKRPNGRFAYFQPRFLRPVA